MDILQLCRIEDYLGYRFNEPSLLENALRHSSYVNELANDNDLPDNERLEFLGDAVLDLVIAHFLFDRYPNLDEGVMSKLRAAFVSTATLADKAAESGVDRLIMLGRGEEAGGGRRKPSILANTMEAVFAAVYLDGGFDKARDVICRIWNREMQASSHREMLTEDSKSLFQEFTQQKFESLPVYKVIDSYGQDHKKTFVVEVCVLGAVVGRGKGASKKRAKQAAAHEALIHYKVIESNPDNENSFKRTRY